MYYSPPRQSGVARFLKQVPLRTPSHSSSSSDYTPLLPARSSPSSGTPYSFFKCSTYIASCGISPQLSFQQDLLQVLYFYSSFKRSTSLALHQAGICSKCINLFYTYLFYTYIKKKQLYIYIHTYVLLLFLYLYV